LESEETFEQFVAATQDLASTKVTDGGEDKVAKWLSNDCQHSGVSDASSASMRRSDLAKHLCDALIIKEGGHSPTRANGQHQNVRRRRSSLLDQGKSPCQTSIRSPRSRLAHSVTSTKIEKSMKHCDDEVVDGAFSSQSTSATVREARKSSGKALQRLESSQTSMASNGGSMDVTPCVGNGIRRAKITEVDFSSDSAKALMAKCEEEAKKRSEEEEEGNENTGDDTLPFPAPEAIFEGVVAYVEFRTKHENRSKCVEEVLQEMGAVVRQKLSKDVTHMIFKDGSLATYNRAKKMGVYIVSNTWIEACKAEGRRVDEGMFPSVSKERYDSPGLFPRIRKAKSMQPKSDEEIRRKIEAQLKKKKRKNEEEGETVVAKSTPEPLSVYRSPMDLSARRINVVASPNRTNRRDSILDVLSEMEDNGK